MTTYMGPVGSLIPVKCASRLTSTGGREVSFSRTLGKQKAFLGSVRAREWSVDIGLAQPEELSGLRWLAEYSTAPLVWYPPEATSGNILDAEMAAFLPSTHDGLEGPLVEVEPGVWVKSAMPDEDTWVNFPRLGGSIEGVPVMADHPVTVSAWLKGPTSRANIHWRDIDGNPIETISPAYENRTELVRVSETAVPPPGAVQMTLVLHGTQVAGPAVTFTDSLRPYSPGQGAKRVVVHGLSSAVLRATEDQRYQSQSFTVTEVG